MFLDEARHLCMILYAMVRTRVFKLKARKATGIFYARKQEDKTHILKGLSGSFVENHLEEARVNVCRSTKSYFRRQSRNQSSLEQTLAES